MRYQLPQARASPIWARPTAIGNILCKCFALRRHGQNISNTLDSIGVSLRQKAISVEDGLQWAIDEDTDFFRLRSAIQDRRRAMNINNIPPGQKRRSTHFIGASTFKGQHRTRLSTRSCIVFASVALLRSRSQQTSRGCHAAMKRRAVR